MPVSSKAKWSQLKVGLMTIVALAILGVLVFLLAGTNGFFKSRSDVYTYLRDSAAIAVSSPVRLNGINVGKISRVELSGQTDPRRVVKITMQIDDDYLPQIPTDSLAVITAENLLGAKYINIAKGRAAQAVTKGSEIPSKDVTTVDDFVQQGNTALSALQGIVSKLDNIISEIEAGNGTIGKLLVDETLYNKIIGITNGVQKVTDSVNTAIESSDNSVGKLLHDKGQLYDDIRGSITRVNVIMDGLEKGEGSLGKILKDPALYDDAVKTIADLRKMLADIDAGKGTVGKLLKSDDLHNQIQATIGRIDTMLDKINQGQGTLGQLLTNPSLYESLDGTTRELHGLLKDFRANPKKFLTIQLKLF